MSKILRALKEHFDLNYRYTIPFKYILTMVIVGIVIMGFYGKDEVFRYYGINKKGYMNCLEVFNIHVRESSETGVEGTN